MIILLLTLLPSNWWLTVLLFLVLVLKIEVNRQLVFIMRFKTSRKYFFVKKIKTL